MLGLLSPKQMANLESRRRHSTNDSDGDDEYSSDDDYHEPSNFRLGTMSNDTTMGNTGNRRVTISDELPTYTCKTNPHYKGHRRSRYSTFIAGINQFDPYQELTATQIAAFRQVFDMVDRDGGGSIDAEELYLSMKDLESGLKLEEIKEILDELDRDGNGEIDFEEFLYMMTSMSLQIKEAQEDSSAAKQGKRRQSIFFSVITKFAMKHSLKEIERYYASKARCQPHVVGHYAAGARAFGLTDREMLKTWKELSHASKGKDSPYAQPLDFGVDYNKCKKKTRSSSVRKKKNRSSSVSSIHSPQSMLSSSSCPPSPILVKNYNRSSGNSVCSEKPDSSATNVTTTPTATKGGWTPRHRLPITKVKLPKFNLNKNKKLKGKKLNITDMDTIRQRVNDARNIYYTSLHEENREKAQKYWDSLKINEMPSERLQTNFKKVFRAYSPINESEYRYSVVPKINKKSKKHIKISRDKSCVKSRENGGGEKSCKI